MAKKITTKTTKKKSSAVKKKVVTKKKTTKAKPSPFKSKLGHDPLAWITGGDADELGLSFDDIDTNTGQLDQVLSPVSENIVEKETSFHQPATEPEVIESVSSSIQNSAPADEGWGLFDDEDDVTATINSPQIEEVSDDGTWGLFGDDEATSSSSMPVGEGVAWGLFGDDVSDNSDVDHDALVIILPSVFSVASIKNVFHEFESVVNKNHDVIVDASQVETMDATGLQLLYAGQKELQRHDCKMVIKDASERVELLSKSTFINEIIGVLG